MIRPPKRRATTARRGSRPPLVLPNHRLTSESRRQQFGSLTVTHPRLVGRQAGVFFATPSLAELCTVQPAVGWPGLLALSSTFTNVFVPATRARR